MLQWTSPLFKLQVLLFRGIAACLITSWRMILIHQPRNVAWFLKHSPRTTTSIVARKHLHSKSSQIILCSFLASDLGHVKALEIPIKWVVKLKYLIHCVWLQIASSFLNTNIYLAFSLREPHLELSFLFQFDFTKCPPLTPQVVLPLSQPELFGSAPVAPEKVEGETQILMVDVFLFREVALVF